MTGFTGEQRTNSTKAELPQASRALLPDSRDLCAQSFQEPCFEQIGCTILTCLFADSVNTQRLAAHTEATRPIPDHSVCRPQVSGRPPQDTVAGCKGSRTSADE